MIYLVFPNAVDEVPPKRLQKINSQGMGCRTGGSEASGNEVLAASKKQKKASWRSARKSP